MEEWIFDVFDRPPSVVVDMKILQFMPGIDKQHGIGLRVSIRGYRWGWKDGQYVFQVISITNFNERCFRRRMLRAEDDCACRTYGNPGASILEINALNEQGFVGFDYVMQQRLIRTLVN